MAGNVWEWTRSLWGEKIGNPDFTYPYNPKDGRENLKAGDETLRVLRGGAFDDGRTFARCAYRVDFSPFGGWGRYGFRVVVSPISPASGL